MAKITIDGRTFDLVMSVYAMGQIEEEFGDLKQALEKFRKGSRDIKIIRTMFRILANAGQHKAKQPMDVTGEEINDLNLAGLEKLSLTMRAAMDEAMKAETVDGGLADDSEADVYAEELAKRKNLPTGEGSASGNTTDTP